MHFIWVVCVYWAAYTIPNWSLKCNFNFGFGFDFKCIDFIPNAPMACNIHKLKSSHREWNTFNLMVWKKENKPWILPIEWLNWFFQSGIYHICSQWDICRALTFLIICASLHPQVYVAFNFGLDEFIYIIAQPKKERN